jgi:hypothetical protein
MNEHTSSLKETLTSLIQEMSAAPAPYVKKPEIDSRDDEPPPDVEALIRKNIMPIRPACPGQKNTRKIRYKSAVSFVYRVA